MATKKASTKAKPKRKTAAKKQAKKPAKKKPAVKKAAAAKKSSAGKTIFFTGFPGFIGKRLFRKILKQNKSNRLIAMVQEKFYDTAQNAVQDLAVDIPDAGKRIELVKGDLTLDNLGFTAATMKKVTANATEVWHLAAVYDLAVPEKIAWEINVEGTRRMLDFCEKIKKLKKLVYFSTCYVAGLRTGLIVEEDLDFGQGFKNHYEQTKFEAEVLVRKRMNKIPTIIIRPSIIIGDSNTGETDKFDGPYFLMHFFADMERRGILNYAGGIPLPSLGQGNAYFNLAPINYLIDATMHIVKNPKAIGKTFQVCDPDPLTAREFYDEVYQQFGFQKTWGTLPMPLVQLVTQLPGLDKFIGIPEQVLPYVNHYAVFDCQNTLDFLADSDIRCPNLRDYLGVLVDYIRHHVREHGRHAKY